jgi:hypothetical protein
MHIDDRLSDYDKIRRLLKVEYEVPAFEVAKKLVELLKEHALEDFGDFHCKICDDYWISDDKNPHRENCILKNL